MTEASERRKRGLAMYKKLGWGNNQGLKDVDEDVWGLTTDFILGDVWSRPVLSLRERQLVTLAALISISSEGMAHLMRHADEIGVTDEDMKEVIIQVMYYVGQPRGFFALRRLKETIAARQESAKPPKAVKPKKTVAKSKVSKDKLKKVKPKA